MGQTIVRLGEGADLIIDEPSAVSPTDRALIVTQAVIQEFSGATVMTPSSRRGSLPIRIGHTVYQVYYHLRVKRIMNALTAYSEAIQHIESNSHLYDRRLSRTAIDALRACYRNELS